MDEVFGRDEECDPASWVAFATPKMPSAVRSGRWLIMGPEAVRSARSFSLSHMEGTAEGLLDAAREKGQIPSDYPSDGILDTDRTSNRIGRARP